MGSTKRSTLQDIANLAGVTKVTVSKALRNQEGVSESVKSRILEIANSLSYNYALSSRIYRSNCTNNIAVLVPEVFMDKEEIFYTSIFKYLCGEAIKRNHFVILNVVTKKDEDHLTRPAVCNENKVDAVIILGQLHENYVESIKSYGFPVILLDFHYPNIGLDCIVTDNIEGMYNATRYLIDRGHSDIGFVGNVKLTSSIRDRYLGYYKALIEEGITINNNNIVIEKDDFNIDTDIQLPKEMPTAFVCNSDYAAIRLMEKLAESHYSVPNDVSIIGFDDTLYSITSHPQLTTVSVNRRSLAENAVTMILDQILNAKLIPRKLIVTTTIIERDSVRNLKING
jgi:LacI family transcriptional regulator